MLQFILSRVPARSIYQIITTFSRLFANFCRRYPKGIDNPFNMSGYEYSLFVCRCCLRGVRRLSYWFDNLDLITEGNTYRYCVASSLPLWGNTNVASSRHQSTRSPQGRRARPRGVGVPSTLVEASWLFWPNSFASGASSGP